MLFGSSLHRRCSSMILQIESRPRQHLNTLIPTASTSLSSRTSLSGLNAGKKVLQSKLRNVSGGGKSIDVRTPSVKDRSNSRKGLEARGGDTMSSTFDPVMQEKLLFLSPLVLEKEELIRALVSESSNCSTLKELSTELSRKLEAQTQRLELLTVQSMASENLQARQLDPLTMNGSTAYADEGDEYYFFFLLMII